MLAFFLQDSLLKLNYHQEYRNQSCWFGLFTRRSRSVQLHSRTLRLYRAMKSRDFIIARLNRRCDIGLTLTLTLTLTSAFGELL